MPNSRARYIGTSAAITAAYIVCGKIGLLFAFIQPNATALWAPTGIAIAALLLLGYRFWPAIFLGALITNLIIPGTPVTAAVFIAIGNTLEGVIAVRLINKFSGGVKAFDGAINVLKFSFFAGMVSTLVSPTIGVTVLSLSGIVSWAHYISVWATWWIGDTGGALLVAPLIILWAKDRGVQWSSRKVLEGVLLYTTVALFSWFVILNEFAFLFIFLTPVLMWAVFRFDRRTLATILLAITEAYVIDSLRTYTASGISINTILIWVQIFMEINFIAMMTLAASQEEHRTITSDVLYRSSHDTLTGLPNRHELEKQLADGLFKRPDNSIALLYLDIDRLKQINDIFGHPIGDMLLQVFAQRVKDCLQEKDLFARLGGDEFVIILADANNLPDVRSVARTIIQSLEPPVVIDDRTIFLSASIGIAMSEQGKDIWTLLANSDMALFEAKRGRNHFSFYTPGMNERASSELKIAHELREAVRAGQIEPYYQPIINLRSGEIMNVEALLRWNHPTRGVIPAREFVGIANNFGLMRMLGEQMLVSILDQARSWHKQGIQPLRIALNLSSLEFIDGEFISILGDMLSQYAITIPLEIEILENVAMENMDIARERFAAFQKLGISVCLDDFGTGYSSLSYLKNLPINKLKIDKSFVTTCTTNSKDCAIMETIIHLGHNLGLTVVAEGIETEDQLKLLENLGCDGAQGYYIAKPMPHDALAKWITEFNAARSKKEHTFDYQSAKQ
jgi:diguanylate cyclase (GGDEF)-like protein